MNAFWRFLRDKRNQQVLGWLGGGLIAAATALWAAFGHLAPSPKSPEANASKPASIRVDKPVSVGVDKPASVSVQADCSGIAIGGNVSGATIQSGGATNSDCAPKPK